MQPPARTVSDRVTYHLIFAKDPYWPCLLGYRFDPVLSSINPATTGLQPTAGRVEFLYVQRKLTFPNHCGS